MIRLKAASSSLKPACLHRLQSAYNLFGSLSVHKVLLTAQIILMHSAVVNSFWQHFDHFAQEKLYKRLQNLFVSECKRI